MKDLLGYELCEKVFKKDDYNFEGIQFPKRPDERNHLLLAAFVTNYADIYLNSNSDEMIMIDGYLVKDSLMLVARTVKQNYFKTFEGSSYRFVAATVDNKDKVYLVFKRNETYMIEVRPLIKFGYKMEKFPLYYFYEKQAAYDYIQMIYTENS